MTKKRDILGNLCWLGLEAPRYTSYPSAHHFSSTINETTYRGWLSELKPDATISIYVHIPFCRELCWFCGCHTKMTRHYEPVGKYVRVLLDEIALVKQALGGKGRLADIHFGGGSPSLLEPNDLQDILSALASAFTVQPGGELAIELDPRTTTPANIALYAELGFNRVSIGVQDFDPEVQRAVNRIQPYPMVAAVIQQLRKAGLNRINCDLMYGLPHQTPARFRATLEKTVALNPSRIALFSYAHVPHMKKHQQLIDAAALPSDADKLALFALASDVLLANGYTPIGIDHFARPDDTLTLAMRNRALKRNFQGYVSDAADALIGVGSSAISRLPQGYAQNNSGALDYRNMITDGRLPIARGYGLTDEDHLRKQVIDALMCYLSIDLAAIRQQHRLPDNYFDQEINILKQPEYRGIAACDKDSVHLTTPHRMAARVVAAVFDQYRTVAAGRYSRVA